MIDWTKPIETVPDERNPAPVPCEVIDPKGVIVCILGDWFDRGGVNNGDGQYWLFDYDGTIDNDWLPVIRNVEEPVS